MEKWIYSFNKNIDDVKNPAVLLGNKGVGLNLMTGLGLPVPQGFTILTSLNHYFQKNKSFPIEFENELAENISKLEEISNCKFGSTTNPLLLSVRSGSQKSMPGMLDTILNIGFNKKVLKFYEKQDKSLFAWDTWRRFLHMFSHVVYKIEHFYFDEILDSYLLGAGLQFEKDLEVNDIEEICNQYLILIEERIGKPFPEDVDEQLVLSIKAVMESWFNERAIDYRRINEIPDDFGTAVNIQRMVFGNLDDESATGVVFSRNPQDGKKRLKGEYIIRSQGEDIVSGFKTPWVISNVDKSESPSTILSLEEKFPDCYKKLEKFSKKLENYFSCVQDIEFTIEAKKLWILQSRRAESNIEASLVIYCDMVKEELITKKEAILSLDIEKIEKLLSPIIDPENKSEILTRGLPASLGVVSGFVVFDFESLIKLKNKKEKTILVLKETNANDIKAMHASSGILTSQGGMTSHAAVVARGLGKTCVTGARDIKIDLDNKRFHCGGRFITEEELITINGENGEVYIGETPTIIPDLPSSLNEILNWCKEINNNEINNVLSFLKETKKIINQ